MSQKNYNLEIDDGSVTFTINNNENKKIKVYPTDFNIIKRMKTAEKEMNKALDDYANSPDTEDTEDEVDTLNSIINNCINKIFAYDVSSVVFGEISPLTISDGKFYCQKFLEAIMPIISNIIEDEAEKTKKSIKKYTANKADLK